MLFRWDSRKNGPELSETKSAVSGAAGGFPARLFLSEHRPGGASSLGRSLAAGEAEATKNDLWLLNGALTGKRDLGNAPASQGGALLLSCCPQPFPGVICRL